LSAQSVSNFDIPTASISTLDFDHGPQKAQQLREVAVRRAREVFAGPDVAAYLTDTELAQRRIVRGDGDVVTGHLVDAILRT
jgi:hypothetical protein